MEEDWGGGSYLLGASTASFEKSGPAQRPILPLRSKWPKQMQRPWASLPAGLSACAVGLITSGPLQCGKKQMIPLSEARYYLLYPLLSSIPSPGPCAFLIWPSEALTWLGVPYSAAVSLWKTPSPGSGTQQLLQICLFQPSGHSQVSYRGGQ